MSIGGAEVARAHWILGAFFLAVILKDVWSPLLERVRPSLVFPAIFVLAGLSMWGAAVFGNSAIDAVVHSLWGDVLLAAGVLDIQRRRGRLRTSWAPFALPVAIAVCGLLFLAHSEGSPAEDPSALWHVLMGSVLMVAGLAGLLRARRGGNGWLIAYGAPLTAFSFLLLTFPR